MNKVYCSKCRWHRNFDCGFYENDFVLERCINKNNLTEKHNNITKWTEWIIPIEKLNLNNDCSWFEYKWYYKLINLIKQDIKEFVISICCLFDKL
jgi:hypothetical protein